MSETTINKIPSNLEECYDILEGGQSLDTWLSMKEDDAVASVHHWLGRNIRNDWGLWTGSKLKDFLEKLGLTNADDMSSVILRSFHRYKNGKDINLDEQIEYYKKFWETPENDRYEYVTNIKL